MTAILFDGFDHGDTTDRWTGNAGSAHTTIKRTGTRSWQQGTGMTYRVFSATEEDDTMYCGFAFWAENGVDITICTLSSDLGTTHQVGLRLMRNIRGWEIRRGVDPRFGAVGSAGTELVAALPNVWFHNSWHYVEFGAHIHDTTGWVEMRQDGITRMRFDGDTRNGGTDALIDQVTFANLTNAGSLFYDDVYVLNEQGSVNNSWLGDTRCYPLYPNGNGTSSTPLSGSDGNSTDNYLLVDEVGPPDITDYVFSQTDGDQDTYTFEDLPVTLGTIRGVEVRMHAAKDDTGTKQIRAITRRSGTDSFGPDHTLAAVPLYQTHHDIDELDPHAGPGSWTISNINSTEWGVEVRP